MIEGSASDLLFTFESAKKAFCIKLVVHPVLDGCSLECAGYFKMLTQGYTDVFTSLSAWVMLFFSIDSVLQRGLFSGLLRRRSTPYTLLFNDNHDGNAKHPSQGEE